MAIIKIDISDCSQCPFFVAERVYTADSFENVQKWLCKKMEYRVVIGYLEPFDESPDVPEWCPAKID